MQLKYIFQAQQAAYGETHRYERSFGPLGFPPFPGRRYTYFMGASAELSPDASGAKAIPASDLPPLAGSQPPGVMGGCPSCSFVAACAANLDGDTTLDVWSISSSPTLTISGSV